jgi:short subunit dehydrogenase-like uncharacterized protein
MNPRAEVLVYGATGFTGSLVCFALRRRGIRFAIGGRNEGKLTALSERLGGVETRWIDPNAPEMLRDAVAGRKLVCACAGPFTQVGEPLLATCARAGVNYVDTTGEQAFVARVFTRYRATAEASGACIVPAMAYEIALSDWGAHLAAERLGGTVDSIVICYASRGQGATRGTQRSALAQFAEGDAMQFVEGALRKEPAAEFVRSFMIGAGSRNAKPVTAASFPSPEAVVVPSHTGAREVRTFMAVRPAVARALNLTRKAAPTLARLATSWAERRIARAAPGPDEANRAKTHFDIVVEGRRGSEKTTVCLEGHDPYGLTGEIQALAAARAVEGAIKARGVVAPSTAFDAKTALAELAPFGLDVR